MSEKISVEHLKRAAYVYIRQSSSYQVRFHLEGQKRQYGLAERPHDWRATTGIGITWWISVRSSARC